MSLGPSGSMLGHRVDFVLKGDRAAYQRSCVRGKGLEEAFKSSIEFPLLRSL